MSPEKSRRNLEKLFTRKNGNTVGYIFGAPVNLLHRKQHISASDYNNFYKKF